MPLEGHALAEVMEPVFEKQEQVNNYKGNGIKRLFLGGNGSSGERQAKAEGNE